jgi:plastocyanin
MMEIHKTAFQFALIVFSFMMLFSIFFQGDAGAVSKSIYVGGNGSNWDKFIPKNATINAGESVTWINPMSVPEPHTVTFINNEGMFPPLFAVFSIPDNTEFTPAMSSPNMALTLMPDQSNPDIQLVVVDNARSSAPVVVDGTRTNITYMQPNANYTFTGEESYVNSGWMFPEGQAPPGAPPISSFTLTFEKAGTYNYVCIIHPWMTGTMMVN